MSRVLVVAEAGVNHNGDVAQAERLVQAAADCGADLVKFQTFRSDLLATANAPKAAYQKAATGGDESQADMLRHLELDAAAHRRLMAVCRDAGIGFLSTPFDRESLRFLAIDLGLTTIKLGSGEVTNGPLLLEAARLDRDIILSTGMSTLADVEAALGVLAFGFTRAGTLPSQQAFADALVAADGKANVAKRVTLLHCTSQYPAPVNETNLRAMDSLHAAFGTVVGLSDHTPGITVSLAAAARGAAVIEKHLTLDRTLPGPDHRASLEPFEFKALVQGIRDIESALGNGIKAPQPSERDTMTVARRSLVVVKPIRRGEFFTKENLSTLRPGTGISPMHYWEWLGRPATRAYTAGELVNE